MVRLRFVAFIALAYCFCLPSLAQPATPQNEIPHFQMGPFTIFVDGTGTTTGGTPLPLSRWPEVPTLSSAAGGGLAGVGHTLIKNQAVFVTFKDVVLVPEPGSGALVAKSGEASGARQQLGAPLEYGLDPFHIAITKSSIRLTPESQTAAVDLRIDVQSFSVGPPANLTLASQSCSIRPDGSISGQSFHGTGSFLLRDSVYVLALKQTDAQAVEIGPQTSPSGTTRAGSAKLHGVASRDNVDLFSFTGAITSRPGPAEFLLELIDGLKGQVRHPEGQYDLTFSSGRVRYIYGGLGSKHRCEGTFVADLGLPPAVKNQDDQAIVLHDVVLNTDLTGALFSSISLPGKIKAGSEAGNPVFWLQAAANNSAWVYFPKWHLNPNSSYPPCSDEKTGPECQDLLGFLGTAATRQPAAPEVVGKRPGLTILHGILYFDSPQIVAPVTTSSNVHEVKVPFTGGLTLTPWGITGDLTSLGSSFIPSDEPDITKSSQPTLSPQPTWQQILEAGNHRWQEPKERFLLVDLHVLEMRVERLAFCKNQINSSDFYYVVHFPFPSFIDLAFEDTSLDGAGRFHKALGPVASLPLTQTGPVPASLPPEAKLVPPPYPPDTQILWAWRLPVTFVYPGVKIDYPAPSGHADVTVVMDATPSSSGIASSEIWLRPLYTKNSTVKSGVIFSATLDSRGNFSLTDWDHSPFMARTYSKPGTEEQVGFETTLSSISLAEVASDPTTRRQDFAWKGQLIFPFFKGQEASFEIKDLVPRLLEPTSLTGNGTLSCGSSTLSVSAQALQYKPAQNLFLSVNDINLPPVLTATETVNEVQSGLRPISLAMSSFTDALLTISNQVTPGPFVIRDWAPSPARCGRTKQVRQVMTDYMDSSNFRDLVCYDQTASTARGISGACCNNYYVGTFQVQTQDNSTSAIKTILSSPQVRYYPDATPSLLDIHESPMDLQADDTDNPHTYEINIPGAQLAFNPEDGSIEGAFGATYTPLAQSLPYEGEFKFGLDTPCGDYYFLGAGSFTYFFRFSGVTLIVHAPYSKIAGPSPFSWSTGIIDDLATRTLFQNSAGFKTATGLDRLDPAPDPVITGILTGGNISKSFNIVIASLDLAAGSGVYVFEYKLSGITQRNVGTFVNVQGDASIGVDGVGITLEGRNSLSAQIALNTHDFKTDTQPLDLTMCVSGLLVHCQAGIDTQVSFDTKSGFDFHGTGLDPKTGCGTGGCR